MKIAVWGDFSGVTCKEWYVVKALHRLGHEVFEIPKQHFPKRILIYGAFKNNGVQDPENWIVSSLNRMGNIVQTIEKDNLIKYHKRHILERCNQFKPDILLFIKPNNIPADEFREICRECGSITAIWNFDWMLAEGHKEWFVPMAKAVDYVFGTDGWKDEEFYKKEKINRFLLRQGIDPVRHYAIKEITEQDLAKYSCDVAFVGSLYTAEREYLDRFLRERYYYKLFGNRPENQVWYEEFAKLCKCAKIIVGDNFVNDVDGYWSDRVYLTLGHGGFLLTRYVQGLEHEFKNEEHLVWWHDYNDLKNKINYWLPKEKERKEIASKGYLEVQTKHTYDLRLKKMLEIINSGQKSFTDIITNA